MLKFFRNIRRRLLDSGKVKSYVLYAIGEILLVVVGILIALQINNWNSYRIDQDKEQKILADFRAELIVNKEKLLEKQKIRAFSKEAGKNFIEKLKIGKINFADYEEIKEADFAPGITNPATGVLTALLSSGDIDLISNDSVKYLITDWKDQLGNLNENEMFAWEHQWKYIDYTYTIYPFEMELANWGAPQKTEAFEKLCNSVYWINTLVSAIGSNEHAFNSCSESLAHLEKMLSLIDSELKNN